MCDAAELPGGNVYKITMIVPLLLNKTASRHIPIVARACSD